MLPLDRKLKCFVILLIKKNWVGGKTLDDRDKLFVNIICYAYILYFFVRMINDIM